jgi:DNA-binding NtrC family response regulator
MNHDTDIDDTTVPATDGRQHVSLRGGRIDVLGEGVTLRVGAERLLIGRSRECALVIDDRTVSAKHAEVYATTDGVRVFDFDSRNGTFVGDMRVTDACLTDPCDLRFGAKRARFVPEAPQDIAPDTKQSFSGLVGTTPEMLELFRVLRRVAPSAVPIVIQGETGTGKERVARAIHDASPRRRKPFVTIDCGAVSDTMLEADLFGHVRGAFTKATRERRGIFVEADGGTLFFDEVAEMSPAMQASVLGAIKAMEVRPIGSDRPRKIDVRTLFTTQSDLRHAVDLGRFREDLYFRIAKVTVEVPPLRDRLGDMGILLESIFEDLGHPGARIDPAGMSMLLTHSWPGNIRELRTLIEVALVGFTGEALSLDKALRTVQPKKDVAARRGLYGSAKKEFDRRFYTGLYASCHGNVTRIAKEAGRQRSTVREALRKLGLSVEPDPGGNGKKKGR